MKKIAIMQPYFFPYLGYFQLIKAVDTFIIYDDVQYMVRSWINRNNLLINGEKKLVSISLNSSSANKNINEIEILDNFEKFRKTLMISYAKAPYRNQLLELIDQICSFEDRNLAKFLGNSLIQIANYLGLDTRFVYSSSIDKDNNLHGQEKILDICKRTQAECYVNAIGGRELYEKSLFEAEGIELYFLKPNLTEYNQLGNTFIEGLSIIDVMMFNDPHDIGKMLDNYELV